jgi:glycosyltransferase involved in cell wall biosynthesis
MKISIIVVAYKRYNQIKCLLYSLLSQTYENFEVIVLHDGIDETHANTMADFSEDPRIQYVQTNVRYDDWGMSLRNIGLSMVTGDVVVNTNDDNYYTPNWLREVVSAFENDPVVNFVYYPMVHSHNIIQNHNQSDYGFFVPELKRCYIDMGQFAVKREIIEDHNFKSDPEADGQLIEEMLPKLNTVYIDKVLFVHN